MVMVWSSRAQRGCVEFGVTRLWLRKCGLIWCLKESWPKSTPAQNEKDRERTRQAGQRASERERGKPETPQRYEYHP